jgi:hypothetical protein
MAPATAKDIKIFFPRLTLSHTELSRRGRRQTQATPPSDDLRRLLLPRAVLHPPCGAPAIAPPIERRAGRFLHPAAKDR